MVDNDRITICVCHNRRQELVISEATRRVGMTVSADDGIDASGSHRQVGVHVCINFHTGGVLSETNVGQRNYDIIGRSKLICQFLRFRNWIGESQTGDVARQFIVGNAVIADA